MVYEKIRDVLREETTTADLKVQAILILNALLRQSDENCIRAVDSEGLFNQLVTCCVDPDREVRVLASESMLHVSAGRYGRENIIAQKLSERLLQMIDDTEARVRRNTYKVLQKISVEYNGLKCVIEAGFVEAVLAKLHTEKEVIKLEILTLLETILGDPESGYAKGVQANAVKLITSELAKQQECGWKEGAEEETQQLIIEKCTTNIKTIAHNYDGKELCVKEGAIAIFFPLIDINTNSGTRTATKVACWEALTMMTNNLNGKVALLTLDNAITTINAGLTDSDETVVLSALQTLANVSEHTMYLDNNRKISDGTEFNASVWLTIKNVADNGRTDLLKKTATCTMERMKYMRHMINEGYTEFMT